jgi:hypothetical protein
MNAMLPVTTTVPVEAPNIEEAFARALMEARTVRLSNAQGGGYSLLGLGYLGWDPSPALDHNHLWEIEVEEIMDDRDDKVLWNDQYCLTRCGR